MVTFAVELPAYGQLRASNELRKRGLFISAAGARCVWLRHQVAFFVDTYSKVAFAKLYTPKTSITAADLLNDKVLPFFDEHPIELLRILTDRGTESGGKLETHDYQLFLGANEI